MCLNLIKRANALVFASLLLFNAALVTAGEPTERIRSVTDRLIEIVTDSSLDSPDMEEKRAGMLRAAVDEVFDWTAFSQRALGRHWKSLNNDQKKEFVELFSGLLERTYMDKTRQYSGEKIEFVSEDIDGDHGMVESRIVSKGGREIIVEYRVRKKKGAWYAYDIYIEGVSLVNNYRGQFNDILIKSSYEELAGRLRSKLED
jgi:phospholipid transport system substrate-binding protein